MDIENLSPFDLANSELFKNLSPQEKTSIIEDFSSDMSEGKAANFLRGANMMMERDSRNQGVGRVYLENKVMDSLKSVLPTDYNDLDKDSKIAAIDKALPILDQRAAEIDPVNKNDTAFYARRQLTQEMRSILGEDVGEFGDKRNRFFGGLIQSITAPFSEEGTTEFLARNLPTKPEYDQTNASVLTQAAGDFVGQIGMIMGAAAAITASGGTAGVALAGSTALGLAQNSSRKFQENYNLAKADMGLSDDEALAAGIAGMPGAVIDSFGDALLLRGIKLGKVGKAFKSMTATEKAAEIVAKGGAILKDPKALRTFGANFIKGGLTEGVSESLGDAATAWGGYATSGHEGFKPSAESLWQSFWVGGLLGGTFSSIANTGKDMKNTRSLQELGKLDQAQFVALGEDAQNQIADLMDKENYTGALEVVKKFKSLVSPPPTKTPATTTTGSPEATPVAAKPKVDASGNPIELADQKEKLDEEVAAEQIRIEDAVAGTAKNLRVAPENPAIAGLKQTILSAVPAALNAVRSILQISPETQGLPSGGQKVSLGEVLTAIETLQQEKANAATKGKKQQSNKQQPPNAAQGGQASQTGDSNSAQQGQAPEAKAEALTREQLEEAALNMTPEQRAEASATLRAKFDADQKLTPEQRAAKVKEGVVTEGEASPSFVITPNEAVVAQEDINRMLAEIEKSKQEIEAAKKNTEKKPSKKAAKKAAKNAEVAPQEDQVSQNQFPDETETSRNWVLKRIDNMLMLAKYKSRIIPSFAPKLTTVEGLANTLKSRVNNGDLIQILNVDSELDGFESDGTIVSKKDADEMISFLEAKLNTPQRESAQAGISNIQGAAQGGLLFQSDSGESFTSKNPKYKALSELTPAELASAATIVKALQALGINDQVSDADKLLALEIKQAINSGSFSDELISKLNEAAPSRAIFQNQVYALKGFGKTTKDTIMKHFDVMALNFLKTGNSLQAFWARVPDIVVVDAVKGSSTARGSFVTQGAGGTVVEDQGGLSTGELVSDVAISTDETIIDIPFSPVPNRIVLVRGKYNASTMYHENDHNMIVTGMFQQTLESQEGGVQLYEEVLVELGAKRGEPWTVAQHEKFVRAREAWINGGEVNSVFTRVFNALKTIFTNLYTSGALTKHRNPVLEKAFVKVYDIDTAPVDDIKAKVSRETGYEASKLLAHVPAGKLQKAQTLIESAKLQQDLGSAKAELEVTASTVVGDKPTFEPDEIEDMKAVMEESYTGKEVPKNEAKYDEVENFLSNQKDQPPRRISELMNKLRDATTFFSNLRESISNIMSAGREQAADYQGREADLEKYFSEDLKFTTADLAQIIYMADKNPDLYEWMPDDTKNVLRFLMNVSFVDHDQVREILNRNPNATFVDFMADANTPEDLKGSITASGTNLAYIGKVNEAISTGLQRGEAGINLNPFAIGKIKDALEGLNLKTKKGKGGATVYTEASKRKIAERLDALYPNGWVMKNSNEAQSRGIFTKTGLEAPIFSSFEKSQITETEYVVEPYNPEIANKQDEYRVHVYVRNGKPEVVKYATGNKKSSTPWLIITDGVKTIENIAQEYANKMSNLKDGDLFGFDITFGADNTFQVTEVNPSEQPTEDTYGGRSGYLEFPYFNMAVLAHIQGRTPPHILLARAAARSQVIKQTPSPEFSARIEAIYQNFKDYASFTREMINNFGGFIVNHINAIFSSLVAGNGKLTSKSGSMVAQIEQEIDNNNQLFQDSSMETVVTREQDQEYLALAADPETNREALRKMADEAAKSAGLERVYHGTFAGYAPRSSERRIVLTLENLRFPAFFTNSKGDPSFKIRGGLDKRRGQVVEAFAKVSDGYIVGSQDQFRNYEPRSMSELKSADTVTYDTNGNVIPLSQRFNPQSNNILYQDSGMETVEPKTGVPYSATVYRATPLKQGEKPKIANEGALGSGIYLAGSKGMAEYYLDFDASTGGSLSGRRLAQFSINLQNPILVDSSKYTGLVDALESTGLNRDKVIDRIEKNLEDRGAIGKWVQAAFQKAGYDGIIAKRNDGSLEIVAYSANSILETSDIIQQAIAPRTTNQLFQAQESSGYSDSAIRGIIGMGHSMLQMAGRLNIKIDNNKIQKQINTLVNSQNNRSGKPVKGGTVQKAASTLLKSFQGFHGNLGEADQDLLVKLAYEKSFAIEDAELDADSLARRNNVRKRKGQPIEEEQRVAIQEKVKTLYNTFRNARTNNFFKNRMMDQISPEFEKVANRILSLVNRGLDNVMGAFNSTNEDLLLRFADNIDAYNKKAYQGTPEFIEQFNDTVTEVEEAVMEHLVRQYYAYNSAYIDAEGITPEIDALIAQLPRMPEESAMDHYERTVKLVNQIEAAMFSIAAEGDPNGQSDKDKKAAKVRAKREKMAQTHQAALLEKFPTVDDFIAYQREKDGGVLTPEFEQILRDNYDNLVESQIEDLSDTDLRVYNSTALTMIVGGSNTQFLTLPKRQWREAKVASWHALVESMTDRVGQSPLVRSIYRSASRSNFLERQLNNFDRVFQANVENFHVWIDRFSQYAPVRNWFDRQFFADFQASVFTQAENARKAAESWSQETIDQYNDETDTTVDANPYLWVMSMLSQYNLGADPNKEFSKAVTRARTSIQRTIDQKRSVMLVGTANKNLAALNYMLEGIDPEADNSYDLFMNNATVGNRIGAGNEAKANKRLELLSNITNYFQQDIANQKFIRESIFGKPFQTVVNYLPLKALKVDGTLDEWDWTNIEPNAEYQQAAQNVNARSNEERVDSLGQDRAYGMDFFNMVERKAVKNALDKHAILPVAILSDMFKTEEKIIDGVSYRVPKDNAIKTIFGSQPEVVGQLAIIKEKITHQMVQIYGATEPATGFVGGLRKALSVVQGSMLSGVGQIVQQSTAAVVDYAAREEGNIGYMIDAMIYWSKNYNKYRDWLLVNDKDLYERGNTQGIREFERHVNNAGSELNSLLDKGWQGIDQIRKFMTISLRYGDKIGAELIFLAEHMKAVKQSGQMPTNGDYDISAYSNPYYTAQAKGQLAKFVGPSSAAGRSYWMSDHKQHYFLLRSLTGSFQSSAHNMSSQMLAAARNIVALQSDKSKEGKAERIAEYRKIGSIMAQQATFTGMRYLVGAMIGYAFVGAIKDAWDDEDGAIEEAQLALEAAKSKSYPSKAAKDMAVTMAERRLADAKSIRRSVTYMKQQASGDALFKSMVRDQLQNLHIAGSVGDGFVPKLFMMVPNSLAEQSHGDAQDLIISSLKKEKSEALAMGNRRKAAQISESILNAQAIEYIPYFYDKKDKSGFGGIVGGMLDPIFSSVKEGVEDMTRADKDFLTTRAFVPDMITYMAAIGLGQADVNRIARQLQRMDDDLSKNRDEANERAGKEVDKLTNKSKTPFLR